MPQTAQFSKSKVSCLFRHRGGNYYAGATVAGKIIRRWLATGDFPPAKNRPDPALKPTTRHYYRQIATSLPKVAATLADCGTKLSDCQLLLRALASFARMSAMPKSTRPFKRWIFITITCCHTHGAARMISETCLSPAPPATVAAISSLSKKSAYPNPACATLLVRHGTAWSAFRKSLRQPVQGVPSGSRRDGKRACTQALPAIASTQPPT